MTYLLRNKILTLNRLAMKKPLILLFFFLVSFGLVKGQEKMGWNTPVQKIQFIADKNEQATMSIDQGYKFADLEYKGRNYRIFFNRDQPSFKKARIVDQESKLEIAQGRGNLFWGSGRFEFIDGEVLKLKKKSNPNGYSIIGPFGVLFLLENHGISPVKTLSEKDFLAQAFFVFDWIKSTQSPPSDELTIVYTTNSYNQ